MDEVNQATPEEQWFAKYKDMAYKDLAARMVQLGEEHSKADREAKSKRAELDVIRLRVIPERFAEDGLTGMRVEGVGRLGLNSDAYCTVKSGLQPSLYAYLRENGFKDIIRDNVNPSTLKSLVKDLYKEHTEAAAAKELNLADAYSEDEAAPDDAYLQISEFVNFTPFVRATVTKS